MTTWLLLGAVGLPTGCWVSLPVSFKLGLISSRLRSLGRVSLTTSLLSWAPSAMSADSRQAPMKLGPVAVSDSARLLLLLKVRGEGTTCPVTFGALIGGSVSGLLSGSAPRA